MLIAFARNFSPTRALYARIDIVDWKTDAPKIGELELIEPELFFRTDPQAVSNFSKVLLKTTAQLSK